VSKVVAELTKDPNHAMPVYVNYGWDHTFKKHKKAD
jgi:hypothetical protein